MAISNSVQFKVSTSVYPLTAIYAASYVFIDTAYVLLDKGTKKDEIVVQLKAKEGFSEKQKEALKGEFQNELLNCALREAVAKENVKIREYIVGQALYSSVQDMGTAPASSEYADDPLEIAVPWEEKYGTGASAKSAKKKKKSAGKNRKS